MAEKDRDNKPQVPPPPPRQPDVRLKGYIEGDDKPVRTADETSGRAPAR
jgi:hypothetical protein